MAMFHLPRALATAVVAMATALGAGAAAEITPMEQRWIDAAQPVLEFARRTGLPLDIVVQPQATPGLAPLAMGFVDGRCKLVLSMRGNREADEALEGVPADIAPLLIEAMTAHEVGHCKRYVEGAWHALPAGFTDAAPFPEGSAAAADLARRLGDMRATRREEGYADLVALAWTLANHPARYAQVQGWLTRLRTESTLPGSHHDTAAWVDLAVDASVFAPGRPIFEQVGPVWQRGLAAPASASATASVSAPPR